MSARLLDPLCAQHKDTVVILDGGQSMGNGQGRAAMGQLFEALAHQNFALIVEGAGGFVQNEDGRVLQEDPRDRNALLLTARELDFVLDVVHRSALKGEDVILELARKFLEGLTDKQLNELVYDKVETDMIWIRLNGSIVGGIIGFFAFWLLQLVNK